MSRSASERGQLDLFHALPGEFAVRDAQDLMSYPFFSLSKSHRTRPIEFSAGGIEIRVEAVADHGMATIWDADILIWAASQIVEARDSGLRTSRLMAATPYQILTFIGRGTSARDYHRLKAALDRLQSTTVCTSIRQPAEGRRHRFSWINEWSERTDASGRPDGIELIVPDWFYRAVLEDALILTIDRAYFDLTGGLDRWLYRLVRKHGGRQRAGWRFDFRHLHVKSGSLSPYKRFAFDLRDIIRRQPLPGYRLAFEIEARGRRLLAFEPCEQAVEGFVPSGTPGIVTATKILWGQILAVFLIVLTTNWGATQWVAWRLGFQAQLGNPWFEAFGMPIYPPPAFFWWWYFYDAYARTVFWEGGAIAASGGFISIAVAITMSVIRAREAADVHTYGSARWANRSEAQAARLLGSDGVVLGKLDQDYLRHDGPEHVLCFAPTRSGKGVGLVVPSLLTWPGSAIVHDIKGENWDLTAGFRARHGRVLRFDPTSMSSAAYNPLLEVRRGEWEVRDVQNVADVLVDPEGSLEKRNHWEKTSHSLLVGAILHVLYAERDKTLAGVAAFLSDPRRPIEQTLEAMMAARHLGEAGPHPVIASTARELLNKSDNERSGVLSTAMSFLGLYRDPVVARVTRRCDWRIDDLIGADQPTTLYLVVPPSDISRTKPLIRLVLNQIGRRLTEDLKDTRRRHRVLMMLDEFPALGRLDFFESALAFMAGYGIKSFLIAQSLNQIEKAYGQNNAILDNCHVRVPSINCPMKSLRTECGSHTTIQIITGVFTQPLDKASFWLAFLCLTLI